jgi:hypothetical protein
VAFVDPWWAIVRTAESSTARESRLLVHFSKAPINLLNGTFACDDVSQEDGLRLRANILTSLPVSAKFISVHRHFTVSQGFAHELLYQANNRAAEVTMYGEIGSIHEDYNRVAATVTAVSIWINRNKKDKVISAIRNSHD